MPPADLAYYSARAREYEQNYFKPERQAQLSVLRDLIPACFADLSVLEVACGTGDWTQYIAPFARSICATDLSAEVLEVAQSKDLPPDRVRFRIADAFALSRELGTFDASFCGFWWSHIPRAAVADFLTSLHDRLVPGAKVIVLDNVYVEGSSTAIARRSEAGDTYQVRRLSDGSTHEVLKNFPTEQELRAQLRDRAAFVKYVSLQHYWYVEYQVAG